VAGAIAYDVQENWLPGVELTLHCVRHRQDYGGFEIPANTSP
jgi:hypothetical protein